VAEWAIVNNFVQNNILKRLEEEKKKRKKKRHGIREKEFMYINMILYINKQYSHIT